MITPITCLTEEHILAYWNRKSRNGRQPGRIDLVVDTALDKHYLVPKDQEHKDFVPTLPFQESSELIPYWIQLREQEKRYSLTQLVVGASSYEAEHEIKHTMAELSRAHLFAWNLVTRSPIITLDMPVKSRILKVYAAH